MKSPVSEYPLTIREHHLDTFGHVNNAVYLEVFEEARWEIITRNGFGLEQIQQTGIGPVILDLRLAFKRELRLRSNVKIRTQLMSYEGKIAVLKQWIVDESEHICCEAEFTIALFDLKKRKIISPTEEWLRALEVSPP